MFGFLKKKLAEVVDSISGKVKDSSEQQPQIQESRTEVEIEPTQQQPERIETTVEVRSEEVEENGDAEVIEIDFDEKASEKRGPEEAADSEPEEKTVKGTVPDVAEEGPAADIEETVPVEEPEVAENEPVPKSSGFVEVEDLFKKNVVQTETAKEYVTTEPPIEERHAAPEAEFEVHSIETEKDSPTESEKLEEKVEAEPVLKTPETETRRPEPETFQEIVAEKEPAADKKSFFQKLTEKVVKKVTEKKLSRDEVVPMLVDLESSLIEADVAVEVADKIGSDLIQALVDTEIRRGKEKDVILGAFRKSLLDILDVPKMDFDAAAKEKKPVLVAFWGFNGAGKTTSLAKTASWLKDRGYTCCFAAADTFRAGAEEQLGIHAENIGVKIVKHKYGADPAAVIFDAMEHAKAKGIDFVLADTAGRAHTNASLMEQMRKIVRVNKPDIKILVIDSLTGNDAMEQARSYGEIGVDAVIFTKVDVNEKGGAILSVTHELKKPIVFLGMGQEYKDFQEFDAEKFADAVLGKD